MRARKTIIYHIPPSDNIADKLRSVCFTLHLFSILQRAKRILLAEVMAQGAGIRETAKLGNLLNAQAAVG